MKEEKKGFLANLEEYLMLIPLAIACVFTLLGFILQFINADTASVLNQYSYYAYTWIAALAFSYCAREGTHLSVNFVENKYPESIRNAWKLFNEIIGLIISIAIFIGSFMVISSAMGATGEEAVTLPLMITYFAPLVGFGLGTVRTVQHFIAERRTK
ncbi:MAG: TRAP transporter small permease subunit [Lachnospiraceae bacterium]|nr:TRAP transporter small permease subunit [Lachnospiraceae bacterium]